jgi:hypothetical protein
MRHELYNVLFVLSFYCKKDISFSWTRLEKEKCVIHSYHWRFPTQMDKVNGTAILVFTVQSKRTIFVSEIGWAARDEQRTLPFSAPNVVGQLGASGHSGPVAVGLRQSGRTSHRITTAGDRPGAAPFRSKNNVALSIRRAPGSARGCNPSSELYR